jgi:GntR family transcriptional regulator
MNKYASIYERSRVPLYLQVASVMRQRIERGGWAHGAKISTLEELEKEFSVARVTVRQAIEVLRDEGLLDAQQGRGTFVSGRPHAERWFNLATDFMALVEQLKHNVLKRTFVDENAAPPPLMDGEGRPADAYAFLRSVQYNDTAPFSVVNLHLDRRLFDADPELFTKAAALPALVEMPDLTIAHAYQTVTIGVADYETASLLNVGLGEPTSDCRLVLVDGEGVAIYVADIHYHKDCFAMRSDLLAAPPLVAPEPAAAGQAVAGSETRVSAVSSGSRPTISR